MADKHFKNKVFNAYELSRIVLIRNLNPDNPAHQTNCGTVTDDYIYCLSVQEVKLYLKSATDKQAAPTQLAKTNGSYQSGNNGMGWWWLRTLGMTKSKAADVNVNGVINLDGYAVNGTG